MIEWFNSQSGETQTQKEQIIGLCNAQHIIAW